MLQAVLHADKTTYSMSPSSEQMMSAREGVGHLVKLMYTSRHALYS